MSVINRRLFHVSRCWMSKQQEPKIVTINRKKKVNCAVYGSGLSASGALAIPRLVVNNRFVTSKETKYPIRISQLNTWEIKRIAAGFGFSLFASDNKLYGAGINNRFQLTSRKGSEGAGQDYYISAKKIPLPVGSKIVSISSGRAHSVIATTSGVFAFGENCHGQCGQDPTIRREVYSDTDDDMHKVNVPSDSPVIAVHCALDTSFVLTQNGEVFAFGLNEDGQCANGSAGIQWKPTKITGDASESHIAQISGTSDTILAISKDGDLFLWGQCEYGQSLLSGIDIQLRRSTRIPFTSGKVLNASSTSSACIAVNEHGEVYVWGVGLLGLGPDVQRLARPIKMDQPLFDGHPVTKVIAGISAMGAINEKGNLFTWGQNRFSLLGLGHDKDQYFPFQVSLPNDVKDVSIGPDHSLFLVK